MSIFSSEPGKPSHEEDLHSNEPRLLTRREPASVAHDDRWRPPASAKPAPRVPVLGGSAATPPRTRFGRRMRIVFRIFLTLLALFFIAALVATLWLRHSMHAALPQLDGTLQVSGLSAPVTVTRDEHGVPSIQAATLDDLATAQGYTTAQDRLWQMDALRRHAAGELAEILGPGMVEHDRTQRILRFRAAADRAVAQLPPDQLHLLEAYARGVNAFIDSHRDTLPVEFHLLHYTPAPWTPRDTVLVSLTIWQSLANSFPTKVDREALSAHLPPQLAVDLYPVGSWRDRPPTQPPPDLTAEHESIEQIPLDPSQSELHHPALPFATPNDLLRVSQQLGNGACSDCRAGSNNWAVAGSHSASGQPLVSNDMHLGLNAPDIWYEASLHVNGGALDVAGFTLPGVPLIIAGRNAHVAWGFTSLGGDVQDVRIEHLRGSGANAEYEKPDGSWEAVQHHDETIRVRGGRDVAIDVQTTTAPVGSATIETPIISPLFPSEKRAISLAWSMYDPASLGMGIVAIDTAADGASLVAAFPSFGAPTLNLVYADDSHHIGYHAIGRIPIRGPAVQHPRELPSAAIPEGLPPADEEEESGEGEQAPQPAPQSIAPQFAMPERPTLPTESTPAPGLMFNIGSPISPVPIDSLDASQLWSGYIPYDQLPAITDPANGYIATANSRIASDDYPYYITDNWADAYRVERISRRLANRGNLTSADMLALENDVYSDFDLTVAQRLAYAIDHASKSAISHDTARLKQAADLLRRWDGRMTAGNAAPAIALATRDVLWTMLLAPQIAAHDHASPTAASTLAFTQLYLWGERNTALEQMLQHAPARWLPPGYATWDDFLTAAVEHALKEAGAPGNLTKWQYGHYHPVEIAHPVFGSHGIMSHILGAATGTGTQPAPGDGVTVRAAGLHFGPSERFTADLADTEATIANITTGESENPSSPHFLDQFQPWLNGTSLPLPLHHPAVTHTLTLTP